jgi:hypothetical protein
VELAELFNLIDREEFDEAEKLMQLIKVKINGTSPELTRAETLIAMQKL